MWKILRSLLLIIGVTMYFKEYDNNGTPELRLVPESPAECQSIDCSKCFNERQHFTEAVFTDIVEFLQTQGLII